jgi:lysophospholipid acyltransferase (LPLAT)-like uncharacterized protein
MSFIHRVLGKLGFQLRQRLETDLRWPWRAAVALLAALLWAYALTLRFRVEDRAGYLAPEARRAGIMLFWHNRMIAMPMAYARFRRKDRRAVVLTSAGPEGSLLALLVSNFGLGAVRGSAARRGSLALREMAACIDAGQDVIITPDGSRGPRYRLKAGPVFLAQKTGCPVYPLQIEYSRYLRLRTWDGLAFPLPFARVDVTVEGPLYVAADALDEVQFEAERQRLERVMTRSLVMD